MKTLIAAVCTILMMVFVVGCALSAEEISQREKTLEIRLAKSNQKIADAIVNDSLHVKDPVTGLCYKYYWGGSYHGGPALATIPCEVVPADKLITGKLKVK